MRGYGILICNVTKAQICRHVQKSLFLQQGSNPQPLVPSQILYRGGCAKFLTVENRIDDQIYFLSGKHVYASSKTHIEYKSWNPPDPPNLGGAHQPYCTTAYLNKEEDLVRWVSVNIHSF